MSDKPKRDWEKEPYNTWDTLAAMPVTPLPADKQDIARLEKKLDRILELLERLIADGEKL